MSKMAVMTAAGLMLALAACGPAPEREEVAAPVAAQVPGPAPTEQASPEAATAPISGAGQGFKDRRRRGPDGEDQTLQGLEQRMLAGFDRLDIDGDGRLTPDELAAGDGRGGARMLRRADIDGDGTLTRDEVRQAARNLFAMMDVDGDGVVTEGERPRRDR
ncbi:EF-hand domain-containing protein [Brevundimonas sp.]|uniref:EF-hand domain-containing protein n=1 Tax=Brevundimonas sp. TaxID=1871086 RepID=UPI0027350EC1|nr:EF-hand domain-containing protein [Brevundimonas sp.]